MFIKNKLENNRIIDRIANYNINVLNFCYLGIILKRPYNKKQRLTQ